MKTQTFHDVNNFDDFFTKFGDEGSHRNDAKGDKFFKGHHSNVFNKNNRNNAGHYLNGHNNVANKGLSSSYGQKANHGQNAKYAHEGGNKYGNHFNKGLQNANSYGKGSAHPYQIIHLMLID